MGLEPTSEAWEASILLWNYARSFLSLLMIHKLRAFAHGPSFFKFSIHQFYCRSCATARRQSKAPVMEGQSSVNMNW